MRFRLTIHILVLLTATLSLSSCFFRSKDPNDWESYSRYLRKAEEFQRKGEYESAIDAYRGHISERLQSEKRADWENPYFYYLLIGDLYLKQEDIERALDEYRYAHQKGVATGLVADRFRFVANWLADRGRYEQAIAVLNTYRELDPLLFDLMRDRIARMSVENEEKVLKCAESESCSKEPFPDQ